jgi:hypothetical protein
MATIHLQGIGQTPAQPARDFKVGDHTMWNSGATSEIINITPKGATMLTWQVRTTDDKVWTRVVKAQRLVAIGYASASAHSKLQ